MMYRRHAALHSTKIFDNIAAVAGAAASGVAGAAIAMLHKLGIIEQAERENRRYNRVAKRSRCNSAYSASGLNGARAVARRQRQIANGSLRRENGLVA